ncbi:solute carrier family 15 member 4-like [Halichondria panicea]|uniref:solute carrier family 15 member 4-like n=1 Tax=Halichondria panicea TaxID=6063 RepID=UPI00312BB16F
MRQTNSTSEGSPLVSRNGCCKYRVRWFYSKGAFLVLVWIMLLTIACISVSHIFRNVNFVISKWLFAIPIVFCLLGAVFSGWLANAKLGNYSVMKYSFVLLFLTTLFSSAVTLVPGIAHYVYVVSVVYCIGGSLSIVAVVACFVTLLQLGLDQMPDASPSNITSFIAWFVFSIYAGVWIPNVSNLPISSGTLCSQMPYWVVQLYSLLPPLCMSAVLILDFLLAKKWLIIEPKSPQSLTTIYRVLKFAAKHKAPLNRSALTYWEENVPSRMDLGKSRYGGPFTTDQVEDVKTILRLLPLCLTLWLLGCSLAIFHPPHETLYLPDMNSYVSELLALITYNSWWCGMVWTVFYEFILYPVIRNRLPSILRKIGIISFLITALNIVLVILGLVHYYHSDLMEVHYVIVILYSVSQGLLTMLLASAMLQLVCAQAPYNMRGVFGGCITFALMSPSIISHSFPLKFTLRILYGIKAAVSLLGFIVYCLLARWYKRRVRDEDYNVQAVVEEVYDRYLSAQH